MRSGAGHGVILRSLSPGQCVVQARSGPAQGIEVARGSLRPQPGERDGDAERRHHGAPPKAASSVASAAVSVAVGGWTPVVEKFSSGYQRTQSSSLPIGVTRS